MLSSVMCFTSLTTSAAKMVDSYTVLVLDTSGSMSDEPLIALKDVAKRFCASLLGADSINEIAIVEFNTTCSSIGFTSDYSTLKSKIESLTANGNTNLYDALLTANSLLSNVSSTATRNIVVLSDGEPSTGTMSETGPYEKGTGILGLFGYHKYANAVYNLMEDYKQVYDVYTVGFFHKSTSTLAHSLLNDINNKGYYDAQNASELTFMFSNIADSVNKKTPKDYDFFEDSYNFRNYTSSSISRSYFTTIYEPSSGKALYNIKKSASSGGLCFGMAYTTAAIYNGLPSVERWTWSKLIGKESATKIRDIHNENDSYGVRVSSSVSLFDDQGTLLNDSYIKYAFIYQWSSEARAQFNSNFNDVSGLKELVKNYANNNRIGVVVCIQHYEMDEYGNRKLDENGDFISTSGHAILAVGVDGKDILIDDPNNSDGLERLTINNDLSWSYSRPWESDGINSNNSDLFFATDIYRPYQIILTGNKTTVGDGILNNNSTFTDTFVDDMERLDANNTLITFTDDVKIDGTEIVSSITSTDFASIDSSILNNDIVAYWVQDSNEILVSNTSNSKNTIQIAKDNSLLAANVNSEDNIVVTNSETKFNTSEGSELEISLETVSDYDSSCISIQGTALSDTVTTSKTDTGVIVTGLNDITITYLENDTEIAKTTASVKDGREVTITVDDTNNKVETDFIDENVPDESEKDNNTCKYCGKVHGDSFFDMIIRFIHMFFNFMESLFK